MNNIVENKQLFIIIFKFVALYEGFIRGWSLKKNDNNQLILTKKINNLNQIEINDMINLLRNIY
jgi:hypothetical protein